MEEFITNNIKILIFVGAAVLWVIGKISEAKKNKEEQTQPEQEPWSQEDDEYDYDERQEPVPPPYRTSAPPPLPRAVAPPVLPSDDRELARQRAMQERLSALRKERTAVSKATRKPAQTTAQPMVSPSSLKARLRDRRELRRVIVMREILDPPVGLR
jgi:type IV secretory pathway VirB10-like protein